MSPLLRQLLTGHDSRMRLLVPIQHTRKTRSRKLTVVDRLFLLTQIHVNNMHKILVLITAKVSCRRKPPETKSPQILLNNRIDLRP